MKKNEKGITLIALVITIIVLIILAAISIATLTGENGLLTKAGNAKEQTAIGEEKEYINLAYTAAKLNKIANGDKSDVTKDEMQTEINKYTNKATVTVAGTGILKITYTSGRAYEIDASGKILNNESYDGMYSVGDLEGKISPQDLFEYEIIDEESKTARILRIKPEYCNYNGYNPNTQTYDITHTDGDIIYNGQKISDMLVIPYEMEQNGSKYKITEVNIMTEEISYIGSGCWEINASYPNVDNIVYPNSVIIMNTPFQPSYMEANKTFDAEGIKSVVLSENLKEIPERAFYNGSNLTSITIPESVTSIGKEAFHGTGWYKNQPDGEVYIGKIFYGYKGEMEPDTNITIREGTTQIVDEAFKKCENLITITIPESVTSIGASAFEDCENLTTIVIPNSLTSIGEKAFRDCGGLTSITIPNSVASIGDYAFDGTAWYKNQPDGELYIGESFYKYKGRMTENTSVVIREGTRQIVGGAFSDCYYLTSVTIPDSVKNIGDSAFFYCSGLTSVIIPDGVTSIGRSAFHGCRSLTNITIPDSVTSIGCYAFGECYNLTSITIPENVTVIGGSAFNYCDSLTSITIPEKVTSIGEKAFRDCGGLTSITIPKNVKTIGSDAFEYCVNLTTINIEKETNSIPGAPWGATSANVNWNYTGE